jgi:uncharacterized protein (DUF1501 family)
MQKNISFKMKRRNFLKYTAPLTATPLMLSGASMMRPFATERMLATLTDDCAEVADRVLVLVQLSGGNDGLNTIIPVDQHAIYAALRPTIGISQADYIELDTTIPLADQVALNPAMTEIKNMYDAGMVNVIQGVSYDNQNQSHFKSRDLYWTGGDGLAENSNIENGWMGRYLDSAFPGVAGNPSSGMVDPLGIELGSSIPSLGFTSANMNEVSINLYNQNPAGYYSLVNSVGGEPINNIPATKYGEELDFIMGIENSVEVYAQRITEVFNAGSNSAITYPDTRLADQFKTIARLLAGGSKTKIFLTSIVGFDTHNNQVVNGATGTGKHAGIWLEISEAIKAFTDDLTTLGLEEKVITTTFSEFGRKAVENGNLGTDHGTLSNMLLFGSSVNPGVTGTNVDLSNLYQGTQLQGMQTDYRQVFSTVLQDWLGAPDELVSMAFPTATFAKIPIIGTAKIADPVCYGATVLPIELSVFEANVINEEEVEVSWRTALEVDAEFFEVQRSADGTDFDTIGEVVAEGRPSSYDFTDDNPLKGVSYYRLKQVENNGRFTYSSVEKVEIESKIIKSIRLSPNPTRLNSFVNLTAYEDSSATLQIVSIQGMIHRTKSIAIKRGFNKFPVDAERLSSGIYIVSLINGEGKVIGQEQLLVQK